MRELTATETAHIRRLIGAECHPRRISRYLDELGYSPSEIDAVFDSLGLRERRMLVAWRYRRRIRAIGLIVLCFPVWSIVANAVGLGTVLMALYGTFLVTTGKVLPTRNRKRPAWLRRGK